MNTIVIMLGISEIAKQAVSKIFLSKNPSVKKCAQYTTRQRKYGEVDGEDFIYVTVEDFYLMRNKFSVTYNQKAELYGILREDLSADNKTDILITVSEQREAIKLKGLRRDAVIVVTLIKGTETKTNISDMLDFASKENGTVIEFDVDNLISEEKKLENAFQISKKIKSKAP